MAQFSKEKCYHEKLLSLSFFEEKTCLNSGVTPIFLAEALVDKSTHTSIVIGDFNRMLLKFPCMNLTKKFSLVFYEDHKGMTNEIIC